ncbi:MAG TPA: twin-arginine translocation signal domain-containing protein, partial [Blastocatellia bacterium]
MTNENETSRRGFLQTVVGAAATVGLTGNSAAQEKPAAPLKISVFSKHLHWLEWEPMARMAKDIGFDG